MSVKCLLAHAIAVAVLFSLASTTSGSGPSSPYYLSHGERETLQVVQSGLIVNSWTTAPILYPLAVTNTVKLYDVGNPFEGPAMNPGMQYALTGTPSGVTYPWQSGPTGQLVDGATDGVAHNYASEFIGTKGIWQYDLDWNSPTRLFSTSTDPLGVTYDQVTHSLWISLDGGNIERVANNGTILSQFDPGPGRWGSLAWEPSTDTLWAHANGTNFLRQWAKNGTVLQDVVITDLSFSVFGTWGGEFAIPVPEPSSLLLTALGFLSIAALGRHRRSR